MNNYKLLITGSCVSPQLEHNFETVSDTMAIEFAERQIPHIQSDKYWNFQMFVNKRTDEMGPDWQHVASFTSKTTIEVRRLDK